MHLSVETFPPSPLTEQKVTTEISESQMYGLTNVHFGENGQRACFHCIFCHSMVDHTTFQQSFQNFTNTHCNAYSKASSSNKVRGKTPQQLYQKKDYQLLYSTHLKSTHCKITLYLGMVFALSAISCMKRMVLTTMKLHLNLLYQNSEIFHERHENSLHCT